MSAQIAHAFAFSLVTTLMATVVIFRAGDGTLLRTRLPNMTATKPPSSAKSTPSPPERRTGGHERRRRRAVVL